MTSKSKVVLYVLCGCESNTWIHPFLFRSLLRLKEDPRFNISVELAYDRKPHEHARNWCMAHARSASDAVYAIQIDNDMALPANFGDILNETITSKRDVVGLKCGAILDHGQLAMLSCHDNGRVEGNFRRTGVVGGGVLIISAEVWRRIPKGPWFRWLFNDDELHTRAMSEDIYFCDLVQQHGLEIWTHSVAAEHFKTINTTAMAKRLGMDFQKAPPLPQSTARPGVASTLLQKFRKRT